METWAYFLQLDATRTGISVVHCTEEFLPEYRSYMSCRNAVGPALAVRVNHPRAVAVIEEIALVVWPGVGDRQVEGIQLCERDFLHGAWKRPIEQYLGTNVAFNRNRGSWQNGYFPSDCYAAPSCEARFRVKTRPVQKGGSFEDLFMSFRH